MNVKALIKKFEERKTIIGNFQGYAVWWEDVKEIFEQLDEPQPIKIPQFVAKKIDYFKKTDDWGLLQVMDYLFRDKEIKKWLEDKNNQETVARAWLDGYEVEKEKRYLVKIKATKHYFEKDGNGKIFFSLAFKGRFTKKKN